MLHFLYGPIKRPVSLYFVQTSVRVEPQSLDLLFPNNKVRHKTSLSQNLIITKPHQPRTLITTLSTDFVVVFLVRRRKYNRTFHGLNHTESVEKPIPRICVGNTSGRLIPWVFKMSFEQVGSRTSDVRRDLAKLTSGCV